MNNKKVLIAGESWTSYTTHVKGFDAFYTSVYEEGVEYLRDALEYGGYEVTYMPNHTAPLKFPFTTDELAKYCCVILSDIGSNTLLLHPDTFSCSQRKPNRCAVLRDYVGLGGGFLMIGGYMSFAGVDGKAKYGQTAISDILPVQCLEHDDLMEHPEGVYPQLALEHEALEGVPRDFPPCLGYNKTRALPGSDVALTICGDPLLAFGSFGAGRTAAFTTDCAPHWCPPEFVKWPGYTRLFLGIVNHIARR